MAYKSNRTDLIAKITAIYKTTVIDISSVLLHQIKFLQLF